MLSGFLAKGSRLSKAQVVFFSQWTVTGRMKNRQHLQAAMMRWLMRLRSLCCAHKVFYQKYLKKQHQQSWSADPYSAVCSPAMRSTVQRYLNVNAKVPFAWNKVKKVGSFEIWASTWRSYFVVENMSWILLSLLLNLVSLLVTCSSFLKYLCGRVWIQALLKSMKIIPLTVYGFWILVPNPQGFSWILLPILPQ